MVEELHVERQGGEGELDGISESEWLEFVEESPVFVMLDEMAADSPTGDRIAIQGPFGCWTGHPTVDHVPVRWSRGALHVRFGDQHAATAARLIADALAGVVVDDDGEPYVASPADIEPAWEFEEDGPTNPQPAPVGANVGSAPPPVEPVPFDFDGEDTFLERILPWFRRQRRR